MGWEDELWADLNNRTKTEQIVMAGDLITKLTRVVLPALGDHRRKVTMELVEGNVFTARTLAESIGTTTTTVVRLLEEGRRKRRLLGMTNDQAA